MTFGKIISAVSIVAFLAVCAAGYVAGEDAAERDAPRGAVKVNLRGTDEKVEVVQLPDKSHRFELHTASGLERLTPDQFARRVLDDQRGRNRLLTLLNISTPFGAVWVAVGLLGQLLFTGRMIVQWLATEKSRRSVVPTSFWWMSLLGASMLLVYFAWRKDVIGVLGQATGWFIYVRNLWLIHTHRPISPNLADDPGPEPELHR
jgi:lipid-A-disaccharide synthase-like uncharacterized protein